MTSGFRDFLRDWHRWSDWERNGAVFVVLLLIAMPCATLLMAHPH
jgi:hypothetical protein